MGPLDRLQENFQELTQSEQRAASFIMDNPSAMLELSLTETASKSGSSNSAIIRLCQKLGYAGFSEFRFAVRRQLMSNDSSSEIPSSSYQQLLDVYSRYINQIPMSIPGETLQKLALLITSARHICIWGTNRTYLSARHFSHRLSRIGFLNHATDDSVEMSDQSAVVKKGDVCIVYTMKGRGCSKYGLFMETLKNNGATVILITMTPKLPLAKYADHVILLPCISRENTSHFYEDQIIVFLFNELLLTEISKL